MGRDRQTDKEKSLVWQMDNSRNVSFKGLTLGAKSQPRQPLLIKSHVLLTHKHRKTEKQGFKK